MPREALALAAAAILLAPSAAGAEPPPARSAMVLPVRAAALASALGLPRADPATIPIDIVRLLYSTGQGPRTPSDPAYFALERELKSAPSAGDEVPLPFTPAIWRSRLLRDPAAADDRLALRIFAQRESAFLYYGLYALDDETLAWLAAHEDVIDVFRRHPGLTAAFARSIRIRGGRVVTPASPDADAIWKDLAGAAPSDPSAFLAHLFDAHAGRLALLYDAVAHLDPPHQRFALLAAPGRARALLQAVISSSPDWLIDERPLFRPAIDISLLLRSVQVDDRGAPVGPASRALWEQVLDVRDPGKPAAGATVDAAWLAACVLNAPHAVARTRLTAWLFAERVYDGLPSNDDAKAIAETIAAATKYRALILTLERAGVGDPELYRQAAQAAAAIDRLGGDDRRTALFLFQSAVALIDRARWADTLTRDAARRALTALFAIEPRRRTYSGDVAGWLGAEFLANVTTRAAADSVETQVLRAISGRASADAPVVEWERRRYRADPATSELKRLQRIRGRQDGSRLDDALRAVRDTGSGEDFAVTIAAIVYATALGDPDGTALAGGPVWIRHQFDAPRYVGDAHRAWRPATESFGPEGWRLVGSLLALEDPLAGLALRRMDSNDMPPEPRLSEKDRRTIAHSAALLNPRRLTDADRDRIAAALASGRARAASLAAGSLDDFARDARLGEWRTRAIAWRLERGVSAAAGPLTPVELLRLGGGEIPAPWGTVAEPRDGCFCLAPPDPIALDDAIGRAASGLLARQFNDVTLRLAEVFAERHLPAALVPDAAAIGVQDVLDGAQPYYFDDLLTLSLAAGALPVDRIEDYVAALTAAGPLVPVTAVSTGSSR